MNTEHGSIVMDIGVTAYGVHIPRYRMDRKVIWGAMGWFNPAGLPGEKAVANYDEDSITMAVAAARSCLDGEAVSIESVYFATTTHPYSEGEGAAIIGTVLGLPSLLRTADFGGSLKCSTSALLAASESVKSGSVGSALVCAADSRLGRPGTANEMMFGDGAAALTIGRDRVIAALKGSYSVSYDFPDYHRLGSDAYVHSVEERFIREEGYSKFLEEAIRGLFTKYGVRSENFAKVGFSCLNVGQFSAIGKRLGFQQDQVQAPLLTAVGEMGAASPIILLVGMLDKARPGDNLLIAGYGNGAEAIWLTVTEEIRKGSRSEKFAAAVARKKQLTSYEKYLVFRGMLPLDTSALPGDTPPTQLPYTWRERKSILALSGTKCRRCGTPQYPPQNVCVNPGCGAVGEMEEYRFSDKRAKLFSYTVDHISLTLNPPLLFGLVDFEGGGRFVFELADCEPEELVMGMSLRMSFRKKYEDRIKGVQGYFWKAVPDFEV